MSQSFSQEVAAGCPDDGTLDAYARGELDASSRAAVEQHLDGCWDCREVVAELARPSGGGQPVAAALEPNPGRLAGRFVVLELLGRGGMGAVYLAYDTVLDRRVAIKVVGLQNASPDAHRKLKEEATTLARVVHPNVVPIHDVIWADGTMLLVMERVEGETLSSWPRVSHASVTELLETLRGAALGLHAVHAAGVVHGDIKPANILVRRDGRACLIDFGLAGDGGAPSEASPRGGTPAYMAPEQWHGQPASVASDQYAFCAAALEVLLGARPTAATTLKDAQASLATRPARDRAPDTVLRALLQGMSPAPEQRHASMAQLVAALAPARRGMAPRVTAVGVLLVAALAALGGGRAQRRMACEDATGDLRSVLAGPSWKAAQARFANKGPGVDAVWNGAHRELLAFASSWEDARTQVCGAWSPSNEATDCLSQRVAEVEAFLQAADATPQALGKGLQPLSHLTHVQACLSTPGWIPADGKTAAAVRNVRTLLARVEGQVAAGQAETALAGARDAVQQAQDLGYLPLQREAAEHLGRAAVAFGKYTDAEAAWWQAAAAALQLGDDDASQRAMSQLHLIVGALEIRRDAATAPGLMAEALVSRTRRPSDAELMQRNASGRVARALGRWADAEEQQRRALALWQAGARADSVNLDDIENELGVILLKLDKSQAALDLFEGLAARMTRERGDHHPLLAVAFTNRGLALKRLGRLQEAMDAHRLARTLTDGTVGPLHPRSISATNNLGDVLLEAGRPVEAAAEFEDCASRARESLGADHPFTLVCAKGHADALQAKGNLPEAAALYRQVLASDEKRLGPDHENTAAVRVSLARTLVLLGNPAEARLLAEAAVKQRSSAVSTPVEHADALLTLAAALAALHQEPRRVCELARQAAHLLEGGSTRKSLEAEAAALARACPEETR